MSFTYKSPVSEVADIENEPFFPALSYGLFIRSYRIPTSIQEDVVTNQLILSMGTVNNELASYQEEKEGEGLTTLADVEAPQLGGQSLVLRQYFNAVYNHAKANLLENVASVSRASSSNNLQESTDRLVASFMRNFREALAAIVGTTAEDIDLL